MIDPRQTNGEHDDEIVEVAHAIRARLEPHAGFVLIIYDRERFIYEPQPKVLGTNLSAFRTSHGGAGGNNIAAAEAAAVARLYSRLPPDRPIVSSKAVVDRRKG